MKRSIVYTILFATVVASNAEAAGKSVGIQNNTSSNITQIYASRAGANNWHSLGQIVLKPGYNVIATINEKSSTCSYDFKFVFGTGEQFVQQFVNVCIGDSLSIGESNSSQKNTNRAKPSEKAIPFDINNPLEGLPLIDNDPRLTPSRPTQNRYDSSYDCAKCKRNLNNCWQQQGNMKSVVNSSFMSSTCSSMADSCNRICGQ